LVRSLVSWSHRHRWFFLIVIVPSLLTALYYAFVASDVYVSESRFVIKAPNQRTPQVTSLASLIQSTGLSAGQEQANEVIDYMRSRSALKALRKEVDVATIYNRDGVDFLSRYPHPWQRIADDSLFKYYRKHIEALPDHETGLIVLTTSAFTPGDAQVLNQRLLRLGERLVNELNARSRRKSISEAENTLREAQIRVSRARAQLSAFRSSVGLIDPAKQATGVLDISNRIVSERAALKAQLEVTVAAAPGNPGIPAMRSRLAAMDRAIAQQNSSVVGDGSAIAAKLPGYENALFGQHFAEQLLTSASASLEQARVESLKQQFYLERVVEPNLPDMADLPHGLRIVLTVVGAAVCLYFIAWMFIVGILEHAPED
jgi:capsular polysaccharide transport system permease protein